MSSELVIEDAPELQSMSSLLERLANATDNDRVAIDDVFRALGASSYGPPLVFTSLIELFPLIGAIPGIYILVAVIVILLAGQMLVRKRSPWLPKRIRAFSLSRDKFLWSVERARPWAARIDRLVRPRMTYFVRPPAVQIIALICIVMAVLCFPLAFIPSSEKVLVAPVFFFGLALTANDGLLAAIGLGLTGTITALAIIYGPRLLETALTFAPW